MWRAFEITAGALSGAYLPLMSYTRDDDCFSSVL